MRKMAIQVLGFLEMTCVRSEVGCQRLITALNKGGDDPFALSRGHGRAIVELGSLPSRGMVENNSGSPLAKTRF